MTIDTPNRTVTSPLPRLPRPRGGPPIAAPTTAAPPRLPGRRNPKWIALGIVALCVGALLSYVIYARVASSTSVVVMVHTVYRGGVVQQGDLAVVQLSGEAVARAVPAAGLDALVGQRAVYDLPEGALVTPGSISRVSVPASGRSVVGVKLTTGRAPTGLLTPSSPIRLVGLPGGANGTAGTDDHLGGKTFEGTVVDQSAGADGDSVVIEVDVDAAEAATIALLAAQDRIAVVREPDR